MTEIQQLFHRPPTVLLAEEDDDDRDRLAHSLARNGYRVIAVEDGLELLDYLELVDRRLVRCPDVIVSELQLTGCDGLEACRRCHQHGATSPAFILLAPQGELRALGEASAAGVTDVLHQPIDDEDLSDTVALLVA